MHRRWKSVWRGTGAAALAATVVLGIGGVAYADDLVVNKVVITPEGRSATITAGESTTMDTIYLQHSLPLIISPVVTPA
jgi:hypothetical protein